MRDIAGEFFSRSPAMAGPMIALVLFFIVFVAITLRVLRSRPDQFEGDAALPLSDDEGAQHGAVQPKNQITASVATEEAS